MRLRLILMSMIGLTLPLMVAANQVGLKHSPSIDVEFESHKPAGNRIHSLITIRIYIQVPPKMIQFK